MNKHKFLNRVCLIAATSMLPLSQAALAEVTISGWINEGLTFYDDGVGSDIVQASDNGTTLSSRITFAGSTELPNSHLTAGFEVILEPQSGQTPLLFSNQTASIGLNAPGSTPTAFGDSNGHLIRTLGSSLYVHGDFGKVTVGLQSMPTDNIAVLADPSLTLWSGVSPFYRGNGFTIQGLGAGATNTTYGSFAQCFSVPGLGIGLDCNGIYRQGVRYDLPTLVENLSIAVGYANDDVYDIAAKWNTKLGRVNGILHLGYSINQGGGGANIGASESDLFQVQAGVMDPATGLFGSIAYAIEGADNVAADAATTAAGGKIQDDTDAWYTKVGIKKSFFSLGDTAVYFEYGSYNDQYGLASQDGVTGSELERIGFSVDQYFGSSLIVYGKYENIDTDIDGTAAA